MYNTEVKYTLHDEISAKLQAIDARMAHFEKTLVRADNKVKRFGKGGAGFGNLLPQSGKLEKGMSMLNAIPNLNMGVLSSAGSLANPYVLAGAAVVAFGAIAADGVRMAEQWNVGMSKANVTIRATPAELEKISRKLKEMDRFNTDLLAIPDVFNQIISGVGDVGKSMDIMQYSLKAARAGFTDINTVADAGVNIMNSVGNKVKSSREVFDVLFATLNKGKGEFRDIANYLPRIIPYSNQLGVSFKETSAMFALMTATGQTTEQSTMLLQNAFVALLDGKKRGNMEKFVQLFDHGKIRPFSNIITDLSKKMKGMSDQQRVNFLDKLGLDAQAASAFSILSSNTDRLKEFIDFVNNSSADGGAMEKALKDSKNAQDNIDRIKKKWDDWKMSLGESISPWWEKFTAGVADLMVWLERVEQKTGLFSTALKWLGFGANLVIMPFRALWVWGGRIASIFDKISAKLNSLPAAFKIITAPIQFLIGLFKDMWFAVSQTVDILYKLATFDFAGVKDNIVNFRNRDWAMNGSQTHQVNEAEARGMYNAALKQGVPQSQLDQRLKKLGIIIPKEKGSESLIPTLPDDKGGNTSNLDKESKGLKDVAGGGPQVRNVSIVIHKQVDKLEVITTNLMDVGAAKIKRILEELLVTSVRDAEIALGQ